MLLYPFSLALAIYHRELWLIQGMAIARCSPAHIYIYIYVIISLIFGLGVFSQQRMQLFCRDRRWTTNH